VLGHLLVLKKPVKGSFRINGSLLAVIGSNDVCGKLSLTA